jgi:hypothetical protein
MTQDILLMNIKGGEPSSQKTKATEILVKVQG